jgi:hypothetical protein
MCDEDGQEVADLLLLHHGVGEFQVALDRVPISPPMALAGNVAGVRKLTHDPVRGALGDAHHVADLSQSDAWILGDADKNLGVIG